MAKRIADRLEKFSVLAAGIGVFQGRLAGLFVVVCVRFCKFRSWE